MDPRYFRLTMSYLESLLDHLEDTDFGLFIFGQDDLARIRGTEMRIARDNVVFELGLFIRRLGRDRSFILMPKMASDFHLPTDLLGIGTATFEPPSRPDRLQAALGPACHDIRTAIRKHTFSRTPAAQNVQEIELLMQVLIPKPEQTHLRNIANGKTKAYKGSGSLRSELRHLRSLGLIRKHADRNIGELTSDGGAYDLADIVELTDLGQQWAAKLEGNT